MMRYAITAMVFAATLGQQIASGEQRWRLDENKDDISGKLVRTVAIVGEDSKSAIVIRVEEGQKATLTIAPADTIFPDKVDVESKSMHVKVTMRSAAMEEPKTVAFRMPWMNYKAASCPISKDAAINRVFAGDSVAFQFDKTGRRYKFPTSGDDCAGLKEAVAKVLEIAADDHEKN